MHTSSTSAIPEATHVPRHVAIIMDGNGRWAKQRFLPRVAGHKRGLEAVRATVKACVTQGVEYLTLFAFSSENWRRPADEVTFLMQLFVARARAGSRRSCTRTASAFAWSATSSASSRASCGSSSEAEARTAGNDRLHAHHRRELRRALGHAAGGEAHAAGSARELAGGFSRGAT